MNIQTFNFPSGFLASRSLAIPVRNEIVKLMNKTEDSKVIIDLSDTTSISESYADECFGVLAKQFGSEFLLNKIQIVNANKSSINNIASVILRRKKELLKKPSQFAAAYQ